MKEIWKDIKGYEGLYQVSNLGRVKSLGNGGSHKVERIKDLQNDTKGYKITRLSKNGVQKTLKVHRLVGEAFIPNPLNLSQINHKNEDKTDNRVENLEFCTNSYNHDYGTRNDRARNAIINTDYIKSKIKPVYQYTMDKTLVKIWDSLSEIKRVNNYSIGDISNCCLGKRKMYKGCIWSYNPL